MSDFLLKTPFFRLLVALAIGIGLFVCIGWSVAVLVLFVVVSSALIIISLLQKRHTYTVDISGVAIMLFILTFGYLLAHRYDNDIPRFDNNGKTGVFAVELTQYPITKARSVLVYADLLQYSDSMSSVENIKGKIVLYLQKDSFAMSLASGDRLMVATTLSLPEPTGNPDEFDFGRHLLRRGICGVGYVPTDSWRRIGANGGFSLLRMAQRCRMYMLDILHNMKITGDEFAVISALTLGYTDAISPELNDSFALTGASHILSVSGLHVGIIYIMLGILLAFLDKSPRTVRLKWILIILLLWFYAFITGLSPSVSRSVFMFSTFALAKIIDRKSSTYNNIFFSAFVLLVINPMWLLNVGFQLSYSALIAIIYFQPKIAKWFFFKNKILKYGWELTSVSIAAQLGAAPICIYYFHQFPNYFLLANFVGVPLSGIIIYLDAVLLIVYKVPVIGDIVSFLLVWTTKIMNGGLRIIEGFYFVTSHIWINSLQLILIYIAIFALGALFYKIKYRYFVVLLVALILTFSINIYNKISDADFGELIVLKSNREIVVNCVENRYNRLITGNIDDAERMIADFWTHHYLPPPLYSEIDTVLGINVFEYDRRSFVLLTSSDIYQTYAKQPLETDFLIVARGVLPSDNLFKYYFAPKTLILTSNLTAKQCQTFRRIAEDRGIEYYSIAKSGAFRLKPLKLEKR